MLNRIKAWLKASPAQVIEPPAPRAPLRISETSMAIARGRPATKPTPMSRPPEEVYATYAYPASIVPAGMAMDSGLPTAGNMASWAANGIFHEGQGFFGYPYLAELLQRAEYRHAAEIWSEHAVRKWLRITGGTATQREAVEAEFERLDVRTVVETWCYHDQAFGRGQIFLDFGDADNVPELAAPLRLVKAKVNKNRPLQAIKAIEPVWAAPGVYETSNPLKQRFYKPADWIVYGKRVHHSRLLTMTSRPVSDMLKPAYAFGGLSLVQMMKPYVDNWLRTRQAVSDMVNSYSILNLKTDMSSTMAGGDCAEAFKRAELANLGRDNRGMWLTDKDTEELENIAVPLSGLHELQQQAQEQLASVARIPLSIYLQISPTGLSANSDGETRNFYADVHSLQEKNIRPGICTILDAVQLSLFGQIIDGLGFEFLPLWEMSDKDKADIRKADSDGDVAYVTAGVISPEEVRERLTHDETSPYHGVDLTDAPPDQGNDGDGTDNSGEFGNAMDEWDEADHPRDDDGKFGSGGEGTSSAKKLAASGVTQIPLQAEKLADEFRNLGRKVTISHSKNRNGDYSSYLEVSGIRDRLRISDHFSGWTDAVDVFGKNAEQIITEAERDYAEAQQRSEKTRAAVQTAQAVAVGQKEAARQKDIRFGVFVRLGGERPETLRGEARKEAIRKFKEADQQALEKYGEEYFSMTGEARKDALRSVMRDGS